MSSWSNGSNSSPGKTRELMEYLERRSQYPDQVQVNDALCRILNPIQGEHILEVGCGSGLMCRLIAPFVSPKGHITGIDLNPEVIQFARKYASQENLSSLITFEVGDAEAIPYSNNSFHGAFAARLLLYIQNPQKVIRELIRVVRPGGRIVLMDWDFETVVVDHLNRELTRRILQWRTDHKDGNNWSGRQLFRLMKSQGLSTVKVYPVITMAKSENNSLTQSLRHGALGAFDNKVINQEEYKAWLTEFEILLRDRLFFASIVYFIAYGEC